MKHPDPRCLSFFVDLIFKLLALLTCGAIDDVCISRTAPPEEGNNHNSCQEQVDINKLGGILISENDATPILVNYVQTNPGGSVFSSSRDNHCSEWVNIGEIEEAREPE